MRANELEQSTGNVTNVEILESREDSAHINEKIRKRLIQNDPDLVHLSRKLESMKVQKAQIEQMKELHFKLLEEKQHEKLAHEEGLKEVYRNSGRLHQMSAHAKNVTRDDLIRQIAQKHRERDENRRIEVVHDRDTMQRNLEEDSREERKRRQDDEAKRERIRKDYLEFIDERRRAREVKATMEAQQAFSDKEHLRQLAERETEANRLKHIHAVERERIASAIAKHVGHVRNEKEHHEELLNELHIERIHLREEDAKLTQNRARDNEQLALLEEYRRYVQRKHDDADAFKQGTRSERTREDFKIKEDNTLELEVANRRMLASRTLHKDLDDLRKGKILSFEEQKAEEIRRHAELATEYRIQSGIIAEEKSRILNEIKKLCD